eukprot:1158912-Pelagomonas_calceolata.AAC.12
MRPSGVHSIPVSVLSQEDAAAVKCCCSQTKFVRLSVHLPVPSYTFFLTSTYLCPHELIQDGLAGCLLSHTLLGYRGCNRPKVRPAPALPQSAGRQVGTPATRLGTSNTVLCLPEAAAPVAWRGCMHITVQAARMAMSKLLAPTPTCCLVCPCRSFPSYASHMALHGPCNRFCHRATTILITISSTQ